jgi:hypothetical protein
MFQISLFLSSFLNLLLQEDDENVGVLVGDYGDVPNALSLGGGGGTREQSGPTMRWRWTGLVLREC